MLRSALESKKNLLQKRIVRYGEPPATKLRLVFTTYTRWMRFKDSRWMTKSTAVRDEKQCAGALSCTGIASDCPDRGHRTGRGGWTELLGRGPGVSELVPVDVRPRALRTSTGTGG